MSEKSTQHEDEINLIDIFIVLWKWKYLICGVSILLALIVLVISFSMSKIYKIEMVLRPGFLRVNDAGKNLYIDSAENIKALIESKAFNTKILNALTNTEDSIPESLLFKSTILKSSNTIIVSYETANIKQGIEIQNHLARMLEKVYSKYVKYQQDAIDLKMDLIQSEINQAKELKISISATIKNKERRIDSLRSELKMLNNDSTKLIDEREKYVLEKSNENRALFSLLYGNTIQQNLEIINNYNHDINELKIEKEEELLKYKEFETKLQNLHANITNLISQKNNVENIRIVKHPEEPSKAIKPRPLRNMFLAFAVSLFFMMILAFILEYINNYKKEKSEI